MASSVELRLPLLDYKLVELVMGLRKTYKTDYALEPKKWFKEAIRNILPERVINHPKRSFMPPYRKWIIGIIKRYSYLLNNSYLVENKIIDPERLQQLFAEPIMNRAILHFVYKLLVLEMWARLVLEGQINHSSSEIFFRQPEKAMA
jgi:asparagine synthase (glutamine-hydrolysing)